MFVCVGLLSCEHVCEHAEILERLNQTHTQRTTGLLKTASDMIPVQFSESVSLANVKNYGLDRCVSVCDRISERRVREAVSFGEVLDSVAFADSVVCYLDSTRRRFRSTVFYAPTIRPKGFSETWYVLPSRSSVSYAASHEHHPTKVTRRWFSASLLFASPKTVIDSGVSVVAGPDDEVFASSSDAAASRKTVHEEERQEKLGKGRHLSTVEVQVASPATGRASDSNNNMMADGSYVLRFRTGSDSTPPSDEVVFRSAVKVIGNPEE